MALSHATPSKTSATGGDAAPALATRSAPAPAAAGPEADVVGNAAQVEDAALGTEAEHDHAHGEDRNQAGKADPVAPTSFGSHDAAVAHNKKIKECFGTVLDQAIAAGISPEKGAFDEQNLLHNSAEWIKAGNTRVHILTPTHDAAARGAGDSLAFFDVTKNWDELDADYPAEKGVRNDPRLARYPVGAHGQMNSEGTVLTMINPIDKGKMRETLIHEVQHDADQSAKGGVWAQKRKGMDEATTASMNNYQSEFRAFWIMDGDQFPPATKKPTNKVPSSYAQVFNISTASFKNARQEAIFWEMAQYDSYKPYLFAWAEDANWRQMIYDFAGPVSGNLVNSVRIQTLSEKLTACGKESALDSPEVVAMLSAAGALDGLDRAFLADAAQSAPFWAQAKRELSDEALAALKTAVAA